MLNTRIAGQMSPLPTVVTNVYVSLGIFKNVAIAIKPAVNGMIERRYSHIAWIVLFGMAVAYGTEIDVKVTPNGIFVGADTKAQNKLPSGAVTETWSVCKINDLGGGIYFSHSGRRGRPFCNIIDLAAKSRLSTVSTTAERFEQAFKPLVTNYHARFLLRSPAGDFGWDDVLFYGFESGRPTCIRKTLAFAPFSNEITVLNLACPPSCDPFITAPNMNPPIVLNWANSHRKIYSLPPDRLVGCLIRGTIPLSHGEVGGAVSIARMDAHGLHFISQSGCERGPHEYEDHPPLPADEPPCDLGVDESVGKIQKHGQ